MTTQRDRLAAVVHATVCDGMAHTDTIGYGDPNGMDEDLADALLARGVRVVDEETLAAALFVPLDDYGICRACGDYTDRSTLSVRVFDILAALGKEA